jgi:uncharacterized protein
VFEYDPAKSAANKVKHGINFEEAQALWAGETVIVRARSSTEPRQAVIGMIGVKYWTAFVTQRGDNIRIISVRRARVSEIELYEKT